MFSLHVRYVKSLKPSSQGLYYGYTPDSEHMGPTGVSGEGEDYQTTPAPGLMWGWFY